MKIACVQCNVAFGDPMTNLDFLRKKVAALRSEAVDFIVFPECFLTGYCFGSYEEALSHSLEKDIDPILRNVQAISDESGAWILVGYAAREGEREVGEAEERCAADDERRVRAVAPRLAADGEDRRAEREKQRRERGADERIAGRGRARADRENADETAEGGRSPRCPRRRRHQARTLK